MIERPPDDELRRLYLREKTSMRRLGIHYSVSKDTVRRWLVQTDIPLRTLREANANAKHPDTKLPLLERDLLERMYVRQQRSATDIASTLGVGLGRVKASLEYYEIPFEQRTSRTFLPPDKVKAMYVDRQWSIQRIASYFGVNHDRVSKLLDELGAKKPKSDRPLPRRKVERFEKVTVALTFTGKPVTRMVAWLECGHKSPIRNQNLSRLPVDATFSCVPCAKKESGS